jgi:hypothetical protein
MPGSVADGSVAAIANAVWSELSGNDREMTALAAGACLGRARRPGARASAPPTGHGRPASSPVRRLT